MLLPYVSLLHYLGPALMESTQQFAGSGGLSRRPRRRGMAAVGGGPRRHLAHPHHRQLVTQLLHLPRHLTQ